MFRPLRCDSIATLNAPLCVSGLGKACARFHSSVHLHRVLTMAQMAALKHHLSGVACRAVNGIGVYVNPV